MWGDDPFGSSTTTEGGGGGGGFMSQGGGAGTPGGGGASTDEKKFRRANNIVPVMVKQVLDCEGDALMVEDVEVHMLTIVGMVLKVEPSTVKLTVWVDDQTGLVECISYIGATGDEGGRAEIPFVPNEGMYGRVVGQIRTMKGKKYITMFKFLPLTDMNELTAHILEVVQVPMKIRKLNEAEALKTGVGEGGGALLHSLMANEGFGSVLGMGGGTGGGGGGGPAPSRPSTVQEAIENIVKSCQSEQGIHKDEIFRNLKGRASLKELESILDNLSGEGLIYSTVDEDHFRSTM